MQLKKARHTRYTDGVEAVARTSQYYHMLNTTMEKTIFCDNNKVWKDQISPKGTQQTPEEIRSLCKHTGLALAATLYYEHYTVLITRQKASHHDSLARGDGTQFTVVSGLVNLTIETYSQIIDSLTLTPGESGALTWKGIERALHREVP